MTLYKFDEILNDLMDYFILGDPDCLLDYKIHKNLPDDLLTSFTTSDTGDEVVEQGIIVPIRGIDNLPYTIYFNLSEEIPELLRAGNQLQVRQDGYCLKVENEQVYLFTMPYLRQYTADKIEVLKKLKKATIPLSNGWYSVSVLGGQTNQKVAIINKEGDTIFYEGFEPTIEFIIKPTSGKSTFTADISLAFTISDEGYSSR